MAHGIPIQNTLLSKESPNCSKRKKCKRKPKKTLLVKNCSQKKGTDWKAEEAKRVREMGTVTPWKHLLLSALESNSHIKHSSFFQFATTGSNGRPSNRTVVFRGFEENSDRIQINTDFRTRKIEELKHCPFAEICWYFTDSWEQFRISGSVDVIDGSNSDPAKLQQREKSWFASSLKSRLQYLGPNPGLPCLSEQSPSEFFLEPSSGPVATFCLLVLDPDQVDYLNLKSNQRIVSTLSRSANGDMCWNSEMIHPLPRKASCLNASPIPLVERYQENEGKPTGTILKRKLNSSSTEIVEHTFEQDTSFQRERDQMVLPCFSGQKGTTLLYSQYCTSTIPSP